MQRFIECGYLHDPEMDEYNKIEPALYYHIKTEIEDHDMWLRNPAWLVLPEIFFKDGTALVIACRKHSEGTNHFQAQCFRCTTNFLSQISDKLCHNIVIPRNMKSDKVGFK